MAIKVHSFFAHYRQRVIIIVICWQIFSTLLAAGLAWLWVVQINASIPINAFFYIVSAIFFVINTIGALILFKITGRPLQILSQAVAHVSKDPVVTPPPHINKISYEHSGLRDLVQTIYTLAADTPASVNAADNDPQSNEFFRLLAHTLPTGIIVISGNDVRYANPAAPTSPAPDGNPAINLHFEQNNDLNHWLAEARLRKVRDNHIWLRVGDKLPGETGRRIFDVIGYYQKSGHGGIEAILVTFDRTTIYANDQEDMDFIALAAHELRGPITVIRGYLDVLLQELQPTLTDDQRLLLDRLQVSSERLANYVSNILNVSRYDRDQFKVNLVQDSIADIIQGVMPDLALRAKTQNRTLICNLPANLPPVAADRSGLSEVLTNLADNAIKYSRDGGQVVIAAAPKDDFIEITVQDSGIGMPSSVVGNLFTRFYRSHRSRQAIPGTGLGLYICKAIVESHGGSIWVRSVEGRGTTFGFTMPTYAAVADKLTSGDNKPMDIVQRQEGWISNHAMVRK